MAAYCRVYDSRHLQADCQEPGSAPEPYARQSSMGYLYLFYMLAAAVCQLLLNGYFMLHAKKCTFNLANTHLFYTKRNYSVSLRLFLTVLLSPENRPKCNKIIFITDTYTFSTNRIQFTWKSNSEKKIWNSVYISQDYTHTDLTALFPGLPG